MPPGGSVNAQFSPNTPRTSSHCQNRLVIICSKRAPPHPNEPAAALYIGTRRSEIMLHQCQYISCHITTRLQPTSLRLTLRIQCTPAHSIPHQPLASAQFIPARWIQRVQPTPYHANRSPGRHDVYWSVAESEAEICSAWCRCGMWRHSSASVHINSLHLIAHLGSQPTTLHPLLGFNASPLGESR